jgi:hypothetical protein
MLLFNKGNNGHGNALLMSILITFANLVRVLHRREHKKRGCECILSFLLVAVPAI